MVDVHLAQTILWISNLTSGILCMIFGFLLGKYFK